FCFDRVDIVNLTFSTTTIQQPKQLITYNRKRFQKITSKILLVILYNMFNGDERLQVGLKPGQEYEDRNSYPEEFDSKRTIRQKSSAVFEPESLSGFSGKTGIQGNPGIHKQIQSTSNKRNP